MRRTVPKELKMKADAWKEKPANEDRRIEDDLRDSEEKFRALADSTPTAVVIYQDDRLIFANRAAETITGYSAKELLSMNLWDMIHHDYRELARECGRRRRQKQGQTKSYELKLVTKAGTERWIDLSGASATIRGKPVGVISVIDITERKQNEEITKASEEKYRAILDNAVDAVIISDFEGVFLEVNRKASDLLGYTREELLGMKYTDIHPEEELEKVTGAFEAMAHGTTYSCSDTKVLRKNGTSVPVDITGTAIGYAGKKIMQGSFREITERKRAEDALHKDYDELEARVEERTAELSEANRSLQREMDERKKVEEQLRHTQKMKAIGTLAGGIAHDFNNILAGIMGFTELVIDDIDPADPDYHRLKLVLKATHRGRDLVRQILAFSRQAKHEQKPVALGDIVEEGLKLLRPLLPATAQIRSKTLTGEDTILADPAQMHQVLINLCTNGVQAMGKKGGLLEIMVARDYFAKPDDTPVTDMKPGDYVILTVRDTGCGIKPEIMERIFDPFFTTKAHGEGTGLGLSVVHGIVKSHGGFLTVESEPGKGSLFSIYMPRIERWRAAAREEPSACGGKECILFVDDEDMLVELNIERLTQLGYEIVGTTTSAEALRLFKAEPGRFDVVITDYTMPDMNGLDLAKKLLNMRRDIAIILCTGHNDDISPDKARKAGIREFLLKPQSKYELDQAIRRALNARTQ